MSINSISPIDGRYYSKTKILSDFFSEKALITKRVFVEINYFFHLFEKKFLPSLSLTDREIMVIDSITNLSDEDVQIIKDIETKGFNEIPATNHDVKAIEYFIKYKLEKNSLSRISEIIHFALTSEDINNISHSLMIKEGFNKIIFPKIMEIYTFLYNFALSTKKVSMLARTHGQPASPTTFGKEILVFVKRLQDEIRLLSQIPILIKLNGATGNYNAHNFVFPDKDWIDFSKSFTKRLDILSDDGLKIKFCSTAPLKLKFNPITTQIEPHDSFARIFDSIKRINTILIDFSQDIWRYISDGWIKQKTIKGEIGSSAMPHKVNPIDFENAEGNLGIANALFSFFSSKLSVSRLQRDLSDSTVQRNIGVAFAHSYIAYLSLMKGLNKLTVNEESMKEELNKTVEVLAEAFQNLLRMEGVEKPYELLKEITRGKKTKIEDFYDLANSLSINQESKNKLLSITPAKYIGIAEKLVTEFLPDIF